MKVPVVWQVVSRYLPRSETFIYAAINNLKQAEPVIVSYGNLLNESEFPLGSRPLYCLQDRLKLPRYITARVIRRITGKDWVERAKRHFLDVLLEWVRSLRLATEIDA